MIYALIVAALSLAGGWVPLRAHPGHAGLQVYLSLAAGALLGAALFHLLPEASEQVHGGFGLPAVVGVMLIFFLQRYVAPHSHEPHGAEAVEVPAPPAAAAGALGHVHTHDGHDHHHGNEADVGTVALGRPPLSGVLAIAALCVHSFFDGVAIGATTDGSGAAGASLGLAVFLSVLVHKPLDGLSVSVLLLDARVSRRSLWLTQIGYAALVPLGAFAFHVTRGAVAEPSVFIGYTLAFSGGTFLAIALTDLLPELHFHAHDRNKLSAALLAGLVVMWVTSLIGHPAHDEHGHADTPPAASTPATDDHADHEH